MKTTDIDINQLIQKCLKQNTAAQQALYEQYATAMYSTCIRMLGQTEDAQEALQDSFVKAFKHLKRFDNRVTFGAWLKKITINTCLNILRKKQLRWLELDFEIPDADETDEPDITPEDLNAAIEKLPSGCKTVFSLKAFEGYTHEEIAKALNISLSTSKSQFVRAKKLLRFSLQKISTAMKDSLLKYIADNRDQLDTYQPDKQNWSAIQNKLNRKRRNRKTVLLLLSSAAVFTIIFSVYQVKVTPEDQQIAKIEARIDSSRLQNNFAGDKISQQENNGWFNNQQNQNFGYTPPARGRSDEGFRSTETYIPRGNQDDEFSHNMDPDYTYQWHDKLEISISSTDEAATGTYSINVTDAATSTSSNGEFDFAVLPPGYFCGTSYPCNIPSDPYSCYTQNDPTFKFNKIEPLPYVAADLRSTENSTYRPDHNDVAYYYEQYDHFIENQFESPLETPLSTFGIDVDGAAYSNVRRYINDNYIPPKDAVKLEELVNYFNYQLPEPKGEHPFSITTETGRCPWEQDHLLLQVALKGKDVSLEKNHANNLVFLIDVSGSMDAHNKLPLLKKSLKLLVNEMDDNDKMAIVTYAGEAGLALSSTSGKYKSKINKAIDELHAGGSTAGEAGIKMAYDMANKGFLKNGNNRILLATDGDFNVGMSDDQALTKLIEEERESGIFLSVLGFGMGNYKDSKMEKLADNGNGNYFYIDNLMEAQKVLVNEINGTLVTVAKDVKLQLEFNPEFVKSYRLLGYENRALAPEDFNNDGKDAGDLGSGHTIIAFYELIPQNKNGAIQKPNYLRYQKHIVYSSNNTKGELAMIKFRYKQPNSKQSQLLRQVVKHDLSKPTSQDYKFASAVAEYSLLLRDSKYKSKASFNQLIRRAEANKGNDPEGYRAEFIKMAKQTQLLMNEYHASDIYLQK